MTIPEILSSRFCSHYWNILELLYDICMEINQKQYEKIAKYLPRQRGNVSISNLQLVNAILYLTENAADAPEGRKLLNFTLAKTRRVAIWSWIAHMRRRDSNSYDWLGMESGSSSQTEPERALGLWSGNIQTKKWDKAFLLENKEIQENIHPLWQVGFDVCQVHFIRNDNWYNSVNTL